VRKQVKDHPSKIRFNKPARKANERPKREQPPPAEKARGQIKQDDDDVPTSITARWLSENLIRVALGPPVDKVPPALDDVVSAMLNWYTPNKRYVKYEWDL
jgi:hypothetical protein